MVEETQIDEKQPEEEAFKFGVKADTPDPADGGSSDPPGYAKAVAPGSPEEPHRSDVPADLDDEFKKYIIPAQGERFNADAAKGAIVAVYDHDGDGFPEYADIQHPHKPTRFHVKLPDFLRNMTNAQAARVPIERPATCEVTGKVVERHELLNGRLTDLQEDADGNLPKVADSVKYREAIDAHAAAAEARGEKEQPKDEVAPSDTVEPNAVA